MKEHNKHCQCMLLVALVIENSNTLLVGIQIVLLTKSDNMLTIWQKTTIIIFKNNLTNTTMRILINGVGYDTFNCEFDVFATIKKSVVPLFEEGSNGNFTFRDGTKGTFYTFTNRRGLRMLRVHGRLVCSNTRIESYLLMYREDVTNFMNSLLK